MDWLEILLGILCVWRITHLLIREDGPGRILARLRHAAGIGFWGQLLGCFYCLSLYVAAPLALLLAHLWKDRLLLWPALSTGAILLERLSGEQRVHLQDFYTEDPAHEPDSKDRTTDRQLEDRQLYHREDIHVLR